MDEMDWISKYFHQVVFIPDSDEEVPKSTSSAGDIDDVIPILVEIFLVGFSTAKR
jgi:hypothetical protein